MSPHTHAIKSPPDVEMVGGVTVGGGDEGDIRLPVVRLSWKFILGLMLAIIGPAAVFGYQLRGVQEDIKAEQRVNERQAVEIATLGTQINKQNEYLGGINEKLAEIGGYLRAKQEGANE